MRVLVLVHPDIAWEGRGLPSSWNVIDYWQNVIAEAKRFDVVYTLFGLSSWYRDQVLSSQPTPFGPKDPHVRSAMQRFYQWCGGNTIVFFDNEVEDKTTRLGFGRGMNMGYAFFRKVFVHDLLSYLERTDYKPIEVCFAGGYRDQCLRLTRENFDDFAEDYLVDLLGQQYATQGKVMDKLVYNPKFRTVKRRNPPPPSGLVLETFDTEAGFDDPEDEETADRIADESGINIVRGMIPTVIARLNNKIVGIGWESQDVTGTDIFFDISIAVDKNTRAMGIGEAIVRRLVQNYRTLKRTYLADFNVVFNVFVVNKYAADILRKLGFKPFTERGRLFYRDSEDRDFWLAQGEPLE